MADRKANLLVTMVFDENLHIGKQVDTELSFKKEITKDLQHLMIGREIKHFVIADDEVINKKLTQERKVGKWEQDKLFGECAYVCSFCHTIWTSSEIENMHYCPTCGAEMINTERGEE